MSEILLTRHLGFKTNEEVSIIKAIEVVDRFLKATKAIQCSNPEIIIINSADELLVGREVIGQIDEYEIEPPLKLTDKNSFSYQEFIFKFSEKENIFEWITEQKAKLNSSEVRVSIRDFELVTAYFSKS